MNFESLRDSTGAIDIVKAFLTEWPDLEDRPDLAEATAFVEATLANLANDTPDGIRSRQVATLAIATVVMISSLGDQIRDLKKEHLALLVATRETFASFADSIGEDFTEANKTADARLATLDARVRELESESEWASSSC